MLLIFWNKCDSMVNPSAFYLFNRVTIFLFPHDPAAISLTNLAPNPFQICFAIICTDNYKQAKSVLSTKLCHNLQ